jgi:hypothetical protein
MYGLKEALFDIKHTTTKFESDDVKHKHFVTKYPEVCKKYPILIKRACEHDFDHTRFMQLIDNCLRQQQDVEMSDYSI